jgi:hypothetical protein
MKRPELKSLIKQCIVEEGLFSKKKSILHTENLLVGGDFISTPEIFFDALGPVSEYR